MTPFSPSPVDQLIASSLACFSEALPAGARVILFGSQARGDARPDSDLDWLVIEPSVENRAKEISRLSCLLGRKLIPADVVVMSEVAFEAERHVPNSLAWRANRDGREYEFAR